MRDILRKHLKVLSKDIGPRGAGTEGEKKAAEYIKETLKETVGNVTTEKIKSTGDFAEVYLPLIAISLLGLIIFDVADLLTNSYIHFLVGVAICSFASLGFYLEFAGKGIISSLIRRIESENIFATRNPSGKKTFVIMAHYDSARNGLLFSRAFVRVFKYVFNLVAISVLFSPLIMGIYVLLRFVSENGFLIIPDIITEVFFWLVQILILALILATVLLINRRLSGFVPGANDNASGVAIMLTLAELLKGEEFADGIFIFLATACEEPGLYGAIEFVKKHPLEDAYWINLDAVGNGIVCFATKEGMLKKLPAHPLLTDALRRSAESQKLHVEGRPYTLMLTDAQPLLERRWKVVTIIGMDEKGFLPHWHQYSDTFENVKLENLETATKLVIGAIRILLAE